MRLLLGRVRGGGAGSETHGSPGPAWRRLGMGGWAEEDCLDLTWINVGL